MSQMFVDESGFLDGGGDAPKTEATGGASAQGQRERFTEGEKLLILQGQITKLKRELVM